MRRSRLVLGAAALGALVFPAVVGATSDEASAPVDQSLASPDPTSAAAPTATPARTDVPVRIAVVGDSISQGTGSNGPGAPRGSIGSPRPSASWASGDRDGLESYVQRLEEVGGGPVTTVDLSANGASIAEDLADQIRSVPTDTDLVLVQMGGNDLCRSDVDDMTPLHTARTEVSDALAWLAEHRPDTLVSVSSIPDIYSLWYVRGAPHRGEQFPVVGFFVSGREGPRAPRSLEENNNKRTARFLWDTLGVVPCQSLLFRPNVPRNAGPTPDPTNSAERRRLRVREHNLELNRILEEECAALLRCRFDDHAVFDLVSNRDPDGVLLEDKDDWTFTDADISTQDHFHPSFAGQRKLAAIAWESGPDWTDRSPPIGRPSIRPAAGVDGPSPDGWFTGPVEVDLRFDDDADVRGIEYRVHGAAGPSGPDVARPDDVPWSPSFGDRVSVSVDHEGESWVEARALDVNGNLSASQIVGVRIDQRPPAATIAAPYDGQVMTLGDPVVARHSCDDAVSGIVSCEASATAGAHVDASTVGDHSITLRAVDAAGHVTTAEHRYHVHYDWSGTTGPLRRGTERRSTVGTPLPVHFELRDARGRPVPEADVEVALVGPHGAERPATAWSGHLGIDWDDWLGRTGGHLYVLDTSGLEPGVWDVVVRPDDGAEHRVNILLTS